MKKQIRLGLLALSLGLSVAAQAQTDVGDIVVTAGRAETTAAETVRTVTVIDRETIERSQADNVIDLLRQAPNIRISDTTGVGAKAQVDLGGFGETAAANSVVLIDGRRVNAPDLSGTDWTQIPVDQIERIEIVHGGGSVLFGQGAVGGVINIVTRIPESGGVARLEGGSFGARQASLRIGSAGERTRVELNATGATTDGYRQNSFMDRFDGGARAEADLSDSVMAYVKGNWHRDRVGLPGSLTAAQMAADRRQSTSPQDFAKTDDGFLDAGLLWQASDSLDLELAAGQRHRKVHSEFVGFNSISDFSLIDRSIRPKATFTLPNSIGGRLVAGADLDRGQGSTAFGGAFPLPTTSFVRQRRGYYGLLTVGPGKWTAEAGLRHESLSDHFMQTTAQDIRQNKSVWEAGGQYQVIEGLRLRANIATSVRFPLLDERFSYFTGLVDTGLQAQTGRHLSLGAQASLGGVKLDLSWTRADLDHEIYYDPMLFANANYTDPTRHESWMLQADWQASKMLRVRADITLSKADFRGGSYAGNRIPAVPSQMFGLRVDASPVRHLNLGLGARYTGASFLISDQANAQSKLPGYLLVDAEASWQWHDVEMFARVDNLLNRKYSSYGVYSSFTGAHFYPAAGISLNGGVQYRF